MPTRRIAIGTKPNDGTGDPLRVAFEKTNENFDLLSSAIAARIESSQAFAAARHEHDNYVPRIVSNRAPTEVPPIFGAMWIDATTKKIFLATGTQSASDWREIRLADA